MRRYVSMVALSLILGLWASLAFAQGGPDPGGPGGRMGPRQGPPPVIFGEITALSTDSLTLKPEVPERMKERMKERGREMPKLPDSITVQFGPETKWYFGGAEGKAKDFHVGDKVVVKVARGQDEESPVAEAVADPETARQYIMQRMGGRGQGGPGQNGGGPGWEQGGPGEQQGGPGGPGYGPGGPGADQGGNGWDRGGPGGDQGGPGGPGFGPGGGAGGPGGRRSRPAMGTITAISSSSVTIKPELPQFLADKLKERGIEPPKLPDSLTFAIAGDTRFIDKGEKVDSNPFGVGDKVVLMLAPGGAGEQPTVRLIADFETAKKKIEEMMQNRSAQGGGRGQRGRQHKGQGKAQGQT
jgi:hypothetical protein